MREITNDMVRRLGRHKHRVQVAHDKLRRARADRNEAIKQALLDGDGVEREIAVASGVSRSRVSQLRRTLDGKLRRR